MRVQIEDTPDVGGNVVRLAGRAAGPALRAAPMSASDSLALMSVLCVAGWALVLFLLIGVL